MSKILPFIHVEDFDAKLTRAQRARLSETEICREYLAAREQLGDLALARLDAGGSLADADILEMAAALERMGEALQSEIERIKAGR